MKFLIIVVLAVSQLCSTTLCQQKKIICYWGTWSHYRQGNGQFRVEDIEGSLCTHIMYTFFGINTQGDVTILDPWLDLDLKNIEKTVALKQKYPGLKVMASIGGWNEGSNKFSFVARDPALRERFALNCLKLAQRFRFDGIDIDWEYPSQRGGFPFDKENFSLLLKEVHDLLKPQNLILMIAAAAAPSSALKSYNIREIVPYLDLINLMTYDFHGAWDTVTGLNSPLYTRPNSSSEFENFNINASVNFWLSQGAPREKLALGIPLYGRTFTLASPSENRIGAPARGGGNPGPYTQTSGFIGHMEFCEQKNLQWVHNWDDIQKAPYSFQGDQWLSNENERSIQLKVNFAKQNNLGGLLVWSIETDDVKNLCGTGKNPLMRAVFSAWNSDHSNSSSFFS